VLELGAGTGELAAQVADVVGPDGAVVATDVSEGMLAVAARTLAGLPSVTLQVADAARLDGVGIDFDAVLCRMGLMFLPDPSVGFGEIHRVLRPGGRMAVAVWAGPEHNPWMTVVGMSAMAAGLPVVPPFGPGGPFSLADPAQLEQLAREAGFDAVRVDTVELTFPFADAEEHIAVNGALAPNLATALTEADDDQRSAVRQMVTDATATYATDAGLRVPGRALVVHGRR
jgi:ubiquinone/menaquinone biosynthesis C-methylase UbiE